MQNKFKNKENIPVPRILLAYAQDISTVGRFMTGPNPSLEKEGLRYLNIGLHGFTY